jgi:transcriptional regulator with XRE-family HTH domain
MDDKDNAAVIFGARLRKERARSGLSQTVLAERTQSTQAYISRVERGLENPTILTCVLLAAAVDCSPQVAEAIDCLFSVC